MDWNKIINWPGITMCVSVISGAWYLIKREILHKKTARFDIALSKIYTQLERFIMSANKVRTNINTMPLDFLINRKSNEIDKWITYRIYEMENMSLLTEMFFESKDRICFQDIVSAAIDFKYELHKAVSVLDNTSKLSIYDKARVTFNKKYTDGMGRVVEMVNKKLLGKWEYDITGVRVPLFLCKLTKCKGHQQ